MFLDDSIVTFYLRDVLVGRNCVKGHSHYVGAVTNRFELTVHIEICNLEASLRIYSLGGLEGSLKCLGSSICNM